MERTYWGIRTSTIVEERYRLLYTSRFCMYQRNPHSRILPTLVRVVFQYAELEAYFFGSYCAADPLDTMLSTYWASHRLLSFVFSSFFFGENFLWSGTRRMESRVGSDRSRVPWESNRLRFYSTLAAWKIIIEEMCIIMVMSNYIRLFEKFVSSCKGIIDVHSFCWTKMDHKVDWIKL